MAAPFVFFYLISVLMAVSYPTASVWIVRLYVLIVMNNILRSEGDGEIFGLFENCHREKSWGDIGKKVADHVIGHREGTIPSSCRNRS